MAEAAAPEPDLDAVVGANLRALRTARQLSLDALARVTGLSRAILGQIELGRAPLGVGVLWRLARAFDVPFSTFLATSQPGEISVIRAKDARRITGPDGALSSRPLFPPTSRTSAEFYEVVVAPHSTESAQPHAPGTRENLVVASGRLDLAVGPERFELDSGDAIVFTADVPHAYSNVGSKPCVLYLVVTYSHGPATGTGTGTGTA